MRYEEYLAEVVLTWAFPNLFKSGLDHQERPDLVNKEKTIGIEVVTAIPEESQEFQKLFMKPCKDSKELEKRRTRLLKLKGIDLRKIRRIGSPSLNPYDVLHPGGKDSLDSIMNATKMKLKKQLPHYMHFTNNYLFIIDECFLSENMVKQALLQFQSLSKGLDYHFSIIFLYVPSKIYYFDLDKGEYEIKSVCSKQGFELSCCAKRRMDEALNK